tara:strand:- start:34 stop:723 length:690 start_codon:yes stop_codon:yes gene_type:complete
MTNTEEVKPSKSERVQMLWAKIFEVQNIVDSDLEQFKTKAELKGNRLQWNPVVHWKVTSAVKKACEQNRLLCMPVVESTTQEGQKSIATVSLVLTDIDTGEQTSVGKYVGYGMDSMDKGPGKAVSYAIKTAMLKTFMMSIEDENEIDVVQNPRDYLFEALERENVATQSPPEARKAWLLKHSDMVALFRKDWVKTEDAKREHSPEDQTLYDILVQLANPKVNEDVNEES